MVLIILILCCHPTHKKYYDLVIKCGDNSLYAPLLEKDDKIDYACRCYETLDESYYDKLIVLDKILGNYTKVEMFLIKKNKSCNNINDTIQGN